jgi:hypothetical protein
MVSRARARRFYEPSRFGRTVSTISIAAKIVAGIETRSEGRDGATGGFACPGTAPHRGRETGLGRAASVAHALPAPSLPHALLAITPRMRAREDGRRHAEQPRIGAGVRGNTEWPVRGHLRDPPVPEIQEDCDPLRQISRPRSPSCQRTSAHLSPPNSRSAASQPDMTSCSQTSWASSNSPLSPSGSNS